MFVRRDTPWKQSLMLLNSLTTSCSTPSKDETRFFVGILLLDDDFGDGWRPIPVRVSGSRREHVCPDTDYLQTMILFNQAESSRGTHE